MVNLFLTVETGITSLALAEVATIWVVSAAATIGAWPISTRHGTQLAVVAVEAMRTSALVCVL